MDNAGVVPLSASHREWYKWARNRMIAKACTHDKRPAYKEGSGSVVPMKSAEHDEQAGFIRWFRGRYPKVLIFAIPNGGYRHIKTAVSLREEGMVSGIPDLYIPEWHLWIEMKRDGGKERDVSESQKEIIRYLIGIGDNVIVGYGATDASRKVLNFCNKV